MTFNISLINTNGKPKTVKEGVVAALISEWPLSTKQLYNSLKKNYDLNVSYQAVHKMINQLMNEKVINKNGKGYSLDSDWVKNTREFSEKLEKIQSNKPVNLKNAIGNFELNSLHESDMFLLDFIIENLPEKKETIMAWQWSHYWIPLFLSMKQYQKIQKLQEGFEVYSVVKGNSLVDKWCSDFWNKQGAKTKYGINFSSGVNTVAFNDYIVQVHYPTLMLEKLDKFFNNIKKIEDLDITALFNNVFLEKTKILTVINKNKELAERIKNESLKIFK